MIGDRLRAVVVVEQLRLGHPRAERVVVPDAFYDALLDVALFARAGLVNKALIHVAGMAEVGGRLPRRLHVVVAQSPDGGVGRVH